MNDLLKRVSRLPQVLQDHIGEFNVEHRPRMKSVCRDIKYVYCKNNCGAFKHRQYMEYGETLYCSSWCESECEYYNRIHIRREKLPELLKDNYDENHAALMEALSSDIEYVECANCCGYCVSAEDMQYKDRFKLFCTSWCEGNYR
jgi:hypothetical protein